MHAGSAHSFKQDLDEAFLYSAWVTCSPFSVPV